jgi:LemA protein
VLETDLLSCGIDGTVASMKKALGCVGAIIVVLLLVFAFLASIFNTLVKRSQAVDRQWAQVQNVYQRRADLVPNLVETVKGAANFEKSTLTEITQARASVGQVKVDPNKAPNSPAELERFQRAQAELSSVLSRLLVVVERYPDLKANNNFRDLQTQLEGAENRITVERQRFNDAVAEYNTTVKRFPTVLIAGLFGYKEKPYFAAKEGSDVPPKVEFNFAPANPAPARP